MPGLLAFFRLVLLIDDIEAATASLREIDPANRLGHDEFARAARLDDEAPAVRAQAAAIRKLRQ